MENLDAPWTQERRPRAGRLPVGGRTLAAADALVRLQQYVSRPDPDGPFRLYHQSFRDFLLSNSRYPVYAVEAHEAVARFLLDAYGEDWLEICTTAIADRLTPLVRGCSEDRLASRLHRDRC
jgi:hypothetical protein